MAGYMPRGSLLFRLCEATPWEERARGRPLLETSEFWRRLADPSPLEARAGLVRVRRDGPPRTLEVPRTVVVIVVVDIWRSGGKGRRMREGAVGVRSAEAGWQGRSQ
jgi:hypothetical protein